MTKKPKNFTFKTEKSTGAYRSFYPDSHYIKFNKIWVGSIDDERPYKIRFKVIKADINEDGNPNCSWKWITLKHESESLDATKEWIKANGEAIRTKYNLVKEE